MGSFFGSSENKPLYDRIGGKDALDATFDTLYELMISDERIKHLFVNTDMDRTKDRQKQIMTGMMGGPDTYEGRTMKEIHKDLKIGEKEF
jgi:hemoglobin